MIIEAGNLLQDLTTSVASSSVSVPSQPGSRWAEEEIIRAFTHITRVGSCRHSVCSRNSPQPCLDSPNHDGHDGQRRINEAGKCVREKTALRTKCRGGVRVQGCHATVCIEFAFGRLGVMTTRAS